MADFVLGCIWGFSGWFDRDEGRGGRNDRASSRLRTALMATAGVDYVIQGAKWTDPSRITYSIAPDGVYWGHGTNTLNASFNATIGTNGAWQRAIARALATWQSVADINIVQVASGSYNEDARGQSQGDPRFGDIRFGAYSFLTSSGGLNTTTLAANGVSSSRGLDHRGRCSDQHQPWVQRQRLGL